MKASVHNSLQYCSLAASLHYSFYSRFLGLAGIPVKIHHFDVCGLPISVVQISDLVSSQISLREFDDSCFICVAVFYKLEDVRRHKVSK